MSPVHTVVRDAIETSGASDDNDVPIYVIESNVRHKLKLDIERAKNEEKRLRDLEKSLRRREVLKVFKYARNAHMLMFSINHMYFQLYYILIIYLYRNCFVD